MATTVESTQTDRVINYQKGTCMIDRPYKPKDRSNAMNIGCRYLDGSAVEIDMNHPIIQEIFADEFRDEAADEWIVSDTKGPLVMLIPKDEYFLQAKYRNIIIDLEIEEVVQKIHNAYIVEADRIVETDNGLALHLGAKISGEIPLSIMYLNEHDELVPSDEKSNYKYLKGNECMNISVLKWRDVIYYITGKKLDASLTMWKGKSALDLYFELGGVKGEGLFVNPGSENTTVHLMLCHPSLQNLLHQDVKPSIKLLNLEHRHGMILDDYDGESQQVELGGLNLQNEFISLREANEVLSPHAHPELYGGFVCVHVFDSNMNIVRIYEIRSPGFEWRLRIHGRNADPWAGVFDCIEKYARYFCPPECFIQEVYMCNHADAKLLNRIASGKQDESCLYKAQVAPHFISVKDINNLSEVKLVFLKRLNILLANFLFTLPPSKRKEYMNITAKLNSKLTELVEVITENKYVGQKGFKLNGHMNNLKRDFAREGWSKEQCVMSLYLKTRSKHLAQLCGYVDRRK